MFPLLLAMNPWPRTGHFRVNILLPAHDLRWVSYSGLARPAEKKLQINLATLLKKGSNIFRSLQDEWFARDWQYTCG